MIHHFVKAGSAVMRGAAPMRKSDDIPRWYFVDESGDPSFYAKRSKRIIVGEDGCSRVLLLGFVRTRDPQELRSKLADVRVEVSSSKYLKDIPSVQKSLLHFHAKDDCPEVRKLVYEAIERMQFSAQVIVARKTESIFRHQYGANENKLYDDLVTKLFARQLHRSSDNHIIFAERGSKKRQRALAEAVERAIKILPPINDWKAEIKTSQPIQEPAIQVIDYVNWAVQRAFEKGEMRYFEFIREKIELVRDLFDLDKKQRHESCCYDQKRNPFDVKKASPLS